MAIAPANIRLNCLLALLLGLIACGSSPDVDENDANVVNVYNWADYIGPGVLQQFEDEYGIKVNYDIYDSSEVVDVKLLAGSSGYDVVVHSNAVTFEVYPPAFRLDLDLAAPRKIKRGQIAQVGYTTRRLNGFISKIHTELAQPGKVTDVVGLRGRGVTFVGQTESGTIQIIANEDAPLGQQPFLRLYGVGVLEDEPRFHGSCFLNLEVVE